MEETAAEAARTAEHLARNAVDCLPRGALAQRLAQGRPLRVKLGLDPTAPDIHLGHVVVLQKLREFQDDGHVAVLIVGDYTARVGDPSGRSATRPVLSPEEIDAHARTYVEQAGNVLRTDPDAFELRFNSEWLDMPTEDLFRLARVPTVAQLLERDDFARRFAAGDPISLLELLYPVLQGYDSVAVRADVELGGTDQTFNLLMGRSIQTAYGQPPQVVLTTPLLTGIDGSQKMSKSLGNHVGITEAPGEMYGRTLSIPDSSLAEWWDLLLGAPVPSDLSPRDAKRALARALVARFHGSAAAEAAEAEFDRIRRRSRRRSCTSPTAACTCPSCWPTSSAGRARRRGARSPRAACASTARPWTPSISPRRSSTDACCRWASASSGACASADSRGMRYSPAPLWKRPSRGGLGSPRGTRYDPLPARGHRPPAAPDRRRPLRTEARRSLKTQQHAHRSRRRPEVAGSISGSMCVQVRQTPPDAPCERLGRHNQTSSMHPGPPRVRLPPRVMRDSSL
jgi:tyrosyl-tRNA synthetase